MCGHFGYFVSTCHLWHKIRIPIIIPDVCILPVKKRYHFETDKMSKLQQTTTKADKRGKTKNLPKCRIFIKLFLKSSHISGQS